MKWINAERMIKVQPVVISVWQMNTDWARQNEDAAKKFVLGTLRGVRDYCNAYHRGPNRDEVTGSWRNTPDVKDPALINQDRWGATDVHGRIFEASVSDIQDTFFKEKLVAGQGAGGQDRAGRLGERGGSGAGAVQAGHDDGTPGCR